MSRLFSQFTEDTDSLTCPPQKRRKSTGLNTRFDHMIQTMNVVHRSPKRRRARSASSASGSSIPKTPIDDYASHHGRLGSQFSVLKLDTNRNSGWNESSSDPIESPSTTSSILPTWLADTFSTLNAGHPLRLLLPPKSEPSTTGNTKDDNPFFITMLKESSPSVLEYEPHPTTHSSPLPFSTAGPCSTIAIPVDPPMEEHAPFSIPGHQLLPTTPSQSNTFAHLSPVFALPSLSPQPTEDIPDSAVFLSDLHDPPPNADDDDLISFHTPSDRNPHRMVYFDSPADDPIYSDPLDVGYELDSLDFQWTPFIQQAGANNFDSSNNVLDPEPLAVSNSDDPVYEIQGELTRECDDDAVPEDAALPPSRFAFWPPATSTSTSATNPNDTLPASPERSPPESPHAEPKFFAPAPGIYISPLRGDPHLQHASQTSNDSIEDWEDDDTAD
ncbi:hypothetical protein MIND_00089100 [Mycena indigotica]|uniref:Uncharacterized protein n=1 Tax=Mycena indigotica TaxID=2126181 RepID=A0A8H6TFG7_9AGAR|nr:uncharacterized protein MIND_00089100 [Mycena indigotica]KAF7315732.1 hypothetical protein MIND_00089100 [Mycena indigotica]